ncbi:MAG: hypothetical protein IPJ84_10045 [Bdellovibrionales bacterium]|nr:hypothetical protein [Bdellovibrionales bacterium]
MPVRSRFSTVILLLATMATVISLSHRASAAFGNYNSMLIGENAAGLGGAFTALYKDSSAVTFYNPAGLGFLTHSQLRHRRASIKSLTSNTAISTSSQLQVCA